MASLNNNMDKMIERRVSLSSDNYSYQPFDTTESPPLLGNGSHSLQTRQRRAAIPAHWPWILSTLVFILISLCLLVMNWASVSPRGTYESGFSTDLDAAYSAIQIKKVRFTGGLHYDANGTVVRNPLPDGGPEGVGPPNPATDQLWDDITEIAGVDLIGREADMVRGKTRQRPTGEYVTGLDVFHQLHCLNKVRQALYPDYYPDPDGPEISALHTDHCLDYIRQSIMCSGDMTPAHVVYSAARDRWSPDFENEHTCRDLQALAEWTRARQPASHDAKEDHHHHRSSAAGMMERGSVG